MPAGRWRYGCKARPLLNAIGVTFCQGEFYVSKYGALLGGFGGTAHEKTLCMAAVMGVWRHRAGRVWFCAWRSGAGFQDNGSDSGACGIDTEKRSGRGGGISYLGWPGGVVLSCG